MPEPEPNPHVDLNNSREQGRQEALREWLADMIFFRDFPILHEKEKEEAHP